MNNHAMYRRVCAVVSIFGLTALAGAGCDLGGPGFGVGQVPEINSFTVSSETAVEGATLTFTVEAEDDAGLESINLSLTGAFENEVSLALEGSPTSVTESLEVVIPEGTVSETLTAEATVTDNADSVSAPETVTVTIQDATPPTISASPSPANVAAGDIVEIDVAAADGRGVSIVQLNILHGGTLVADTADTLSAPAQNYSQTWQWAAPDLEPGALRFVPSVVDRNGLSTTGDTTSIQLGDETGPTFVSLSTVPDSTVPLADSFQVIVTVRDPAGLQSVSFVGLAYRGDASMGTDEVVERFAEKVITFPRPTEADTLPKTYTLDPYLLPANEADPEAFELVLVATDSLGNQSDTVRAMFVGGPDVTLTSPPDGFEVGVNSDIGIKAKFDDSAGIDSAKIVVGGVLNSVIDLTLPTVTDTAFTVDTALTMTAQGDVTLQALAWNTAEIQGQSGTATVTVLADQPADEIAPDFTMTAERLTPAVSEDRMELLDEVRVTATALDGNAGLDSIRVDIVARRDGAETTLSNTLDLNGSNREEELIYRVAIDEIYAAFGITDPAVLDSILPEPINLAVSAIAVDVAGNDSTLEASLAVDAVRGTTVLLDNTAAVIADLAVDTIYDRLFMSNVTENLVEFVQLDADPRNIAFENPVQVGSEPLGVFLGERVVSSSETSFGGLTLTAGDTVPTLLVGNSGGTNVSLVHVGDANAANVQEVDVVRLRTPNARLFSMAVSEDEDGTNIFEDPPQVIDMADRPQFLAQDWKLRVVYSTVGTSSAPLTTVRYLHLDPDPTSTTDEPEAFFMLTTEMVLGGGGEVTEWVFGNVDNVDTQHYDDATDQIRLISHVPGYPDQPMVTPYFAEVEFAVQALMDSIDVYMTARGIPEQADLFYPFVAAGSWNFDALGWGDTTFISASGDRTKLAIGEGASSPTGRIMLWHADPTGTYWSDEIKITDLVNNAAEVVLGVGLNENGSLGVARGNEATYFFTPDLRLQGLYSQEDFGGAGATFHPEHDELSDGGHTSTDGTGAAFTGTSENSIDVVNTFHFNQTNSLVIRDNIVGPLRAGPPLSTDNTGLTCPTDLDCVVVKLYGITDAGGVVVVNVRRRDLEPYATP